MRAARVVVDLDQRIGRINPGLYGHFAEHLGHCIEQGVWVGEDSPIPNVRGIRADVVEVLRRVRPSVVRWPGGCFADDYHWRDGVGPRERRPHRVNVHWGMVPETNHFGTHEFMDLCRQIGAEPYICGNVGSGTVREMRDWVEYCNHDGPSTLADERRANGSVAPFGVRYWGVGNESWGCGGRMTAHRYADEFARYAIYLFPFGGKAPCRIACGPSGDSPEWTRRFFEALSGQRDGAPSRLNLLDAFAAHYYCGTAGTAMDYTVDQWYELLAKALRVEPLIVRHRAIMDGFDPERRIGLILDEWGTWHPVIPGTPPRFLRQQNTIRDGLVAALTLDVLNRHADKVVMANIAQMVNVLQAMCLTDGPRMFVTPTYHVYDMYAPHQDATSVATRVEAEPIPFATDRSQGNVAGVAGSASVRGDRLTLSLVNAHVSEGVAARIVLRPLAARSPESVRVLAADDIHAHNDFGSSDRVRPHEGVATGNAVELPPASVAVLAYPVS